MKGQVFFLLVTLAFYTSLITPIIKRGAIYEKNGRFVFLLGDFHKAVPDPCINYAQAELLIQYLKLYNSKKIVAIVEDVLDPPAHKTIMLKTQNKQESHINRKKHFIYETHILPLILKKIRYISPISHFNKLLKICGIKTVNAECRSVQLAFSNNFNFSARDIRYEIEKSMHSIDSYIQKITNSQLSHKKTIIDFYTQKLSHIKNNTKAYRDFLTKNSALSVDYLLTCSPLSKKSDVIVSAIRKKLDAHFYDLASLVDMHILYNIIQHQNTPITIICAGMCHTVAAENILEQLGFILVTESGTSKLDVLMSKQNLGSPDASIDDLCVYLKKAHAISEKMPKQIYYCDYCFQTQSKEKIKVCSKCHTRCYCDKICQKKDWRTHKSVCKKGCNPK